MARGAGAVGRPLASSAGRVDGAARRLAAASSPTPAPVPADVAPVEASPEPPARPASPRGSSVRSANLGDVSAERRLIEQAQTALARGDGAAALEATAQHAARYPQGALAEEREYVAILALEQTGRGDDAARRGAKFLRTFPSSVFAPRVAALFDAPE